MADGVRNQFGEIESFQTALSNPETHKRCVSIMLRNIIKQRYATPSHFTNASKPVQAVRARSGHRRVASEGRESVTTISASKLSLRLSEPCLPSDAPPEPQAPEQESAWPGDNEQATDTRTSRGGKDEKNNNVERSITISQDGSDDAISKTLLVGPRALITEGVQSSDTALTCITLDNLMGGLKEKDRYAVRNMGHAKLAHDSTADTGISFEGLIDRLLSEGVSKSHWKFTVTFLCLYRKFAAPSELLVGIISRFEDLSNSDAPDLTKLTAQLRYLNILQGWMSDYPGDFAHPWTRRIITNFIHSLGSCPEFAVAYKEISPYLDIVCDDDDTEWACSDQRRSRASTIESFITTSSTQSRASTVTADSSTEDVIEHVHLKKASTRRSAQGSQSIDCSVERGILATKPSTHILLHSNEDARRQAQLLAPVPTHVIDKNRWHDLMNIPEESIASELTRIDWTLYSSIRPRDLVRHISLNPGLKEKCRSLEYVNRMIDQFNHVALWVANMILLRDKPKHRARILEKFMRVAWKLRYLNNYNSLGAIIAGVNGTAVHRLSQTRELVSPEARKEFMRLEILMGTAKSHSAYRLGWQNTTTPRIPFLPLHRRDLVFAEEGNRTYIGDDEREGINWRKFEVMGEIIIGIRKSQEMPYRSIKKNEDVLRLIMDGKFSKDEDELYERSIQLEGQGVGENIRKKFNWFQR
ncbi:MAG: hypothetical protein Q9163_004376 [Psora crenata]